MTLFLLLWRHEVAKAIVDCWTFFRWVINYTRRHSWTLFITINIWRFFEHNRKSGPHHIVLFSIWGMSNAWKLYFELIKFHWNWKSILKLHFDDFLQGQISKPHSRQSTVWKFNFFPLHQIFTWNQLYKSNTVFETTILPVSYPLKIDFCQFEQW